MIKTKISITIDEDLNDVLEINSENIGCSKSTYINMILKRELKKEIGDVQ